MRALARITPDPAALMGRFAAEGWLGNAFLEGASGRRFRMGPARAGMPGGEVVESATGRWRAVHPVPPTAEHACLVALDAGDMPTAEAHGRAFAAAVWAAQGIAGSPPERVIWRLSGWGSAPSRSFRPHLGALPAWPPAAAGDRTDAFAWAAGLLGWRAAWRAHRTAEGTLGVDPWGPLLDLLGTGFCLYGLHDSAIVLFQPVGPVPTRVDAQRVQPNQRAEATAELARALTVFAPERARRALLDGARLQDDALEMFVRRFAWLRTDTQGPAISLCVQALVDAGAVVSGSERSYGAVALAALGNNPAAVGLLVAGGVPVDVADARGRTALHGLAANGHAVGVGRLLDAGADPEREDELGWTPVHVALSHGHPLVLAELERAGARFDRPTGRGQAPASLIAVHPPEVRSALARWAPDVSSPRIPRPDRVVPPPALLARAVRDGVPGSWAVLGDWLAEQGDPRGAAIALSAVGRERDAAAHALAGGALARRALLGMHPGVEALLADDQVRWEDDRGFVRVIRLQHERTARHGPALAAICPSPQLALLERIDVLTDARSLVEGLSGVRAEVPGALRLLAQTEALPELDLRGLTGLRTLALRGLGVHGLTVRAPHLHRLAVELPHVKDRALPPTFDVLETPELRALHLTLARAAHGEEASWLGPSLLQGRSAPVLRELSLRPVSETLLDMLAHSPVLPRLTHLALDSCWPVVVQRIIARAPSFAHLTGLEITVVRAEAEERRALSRALAEVLPRARLAGIGFRGVGSYGDSGHRRSALRL